MEDYVDSKEKSSQVEVRAVFIECIVSYIFYIRPDTLSRVAISNCILLKRMLFNTFGCNLVYDINLAVVELFVRDRLGKYTYIFITIHTYYHQGVMWALMRSDF